MFPLPVAAQTKAWSGVCIADRTATPGAGDVATFLGLQCLIANILSIALTLIGLAGFVMIIIGGFRYMLSGSDPKGADAARNTITFAVVGLVVALSAFIILNLIAAFTGIPSLTMFKLTI